MTKIRLFNKIGLYIFLFLPRQPSRCRGQQAMIQKKKKNNNQKVNLTEYDKPLYHKLIGMFWNVLECAKMC